MSAMGLVRKVLRFFRSITLLRQLRAAVPADPAKLDLALFLNLCAKFALANYFFWDHFMSEDATEPGEGQHPCTLGLPVHGHAASPTASAHGSRSLRQYTSCKQTRCRCHSSPLR